MILSRLALVLVLVSSLVATTRAVQDLAHNRIVILTDKANSGGANRPDVNSNAFESDLGLAADYASTGANDEAGGATESSDRNTGSADTARASQLKQSLTTAMSTAVDAADVDDLESRMNLGEGSAVSPFNQATLDTEDAEGAPDDSTAALLRAAAAADEASRKAHLAEEANLIAEQAQQQEQQLHQVSSSLDADRAQLSALNHNKQDNDNESDDEDSEDSEDSESAEDADDEDGAELAAGSSSPQPVHHRARFAADSDADKQKLAAQQAADLKKKQEAELAAKKKKEADDAAAAKKKADDENDKKKKAAADKLKAAAAKVYQPKKEGLITPCDMLAERGVCLFGGQKVLLPDSVSKGLRLWMKFDEAQALDSSRLQNHGTSVMLNGPGRGGFGSSARFDGDTFLEVPSSPSLATTLKESSVSFWAFFISDPEDKENFDCPIIYMGREQDSVFEVRFNPETRKISATIIKNWVTLKSRAKLGPSTWHHIALTKGPKYAHLYINGVLDVEATLPDQLLNSTSKVLPQPLFQFYAGAVPWNGRRLGNGKCNVPLLMDDLRVLDRALRIDEVEAESSSALGSVEPSFIRFGCEKCTFRDAVKSCPKTHHLCSKPELLAGGLAAARKMGWVGLQHPVWENDVTDINPVHIGPDNEVRAAICCAY